MPVARGVYRLQIAWDAYSFGLLSFDHSTFGGSDVFGITPLDITFGGTYDDVSPRLKRATARRGRDNNLDVMLAGEATFDLRDPDGIFNPENVSGPLYGILESRLHPVRWEGRAVGGSFKGLFTGWVRRFTWEPHGRRGITQVECVDAFYWLEGVNPVIVGTGPTTTGAAIGLILDAVGLKDMAMRDLDDGDTIPDFFADGSKNGLDLIQELLEAERGVFYIAGNGQATYRSRIARYVMTSAFTLADRMRAMGSGVDFDSAMTRVRVSRLDGLGEITYTAEATSTGGDLQRLRIADLPEIKTVYLSSDAQAEALADWILAQVESPKPPLYGVEIDNRDSDLLEQILTRELTDRITATAVKGGTAGDYHLDRIEQNYEAGSHSVSWLCSRASSVTPAVFDVARFDDAVFVY